MEKRTYRIHLAASILAPLTLLVSIAYTTMYRAVGLTGRYLTPALVVLFFAVGYFLMCAEERIFGLTRVNFAIDDGIEDVLPRYIRKRYLLIPALIAMIPAGLMVPLVDKEIHRLVDIGELDYYSDDFLAPWLIFFFIVLAAVLGAAARMQPGNLALSPFSCRIHVICYIAIYIINLFMEVPSTLPTVLLTLMIIAAAFELNTAFVQDITRKTHNTESMPGLLDTNFHYVKRIVINFIKVFIVPLILTAAASIVWQYLLETRLNQPL